MQKFSNTLSNQNDDEEIEEDIKYEGKFEMIQDDEVNNDNDDQFIESIIGHNTDDYKFDAFIEKLQEIVIEDQFENLQEEFFSKHCDEFEDKEENKLSYTKIFKDYTKLTESYIESNLKKRLPNYKLEDFYKLLQTRKNEIDEQLYDMLLSFTDFQIFKEMVLDYKRRKSNPTSGGLFGILIEKANLSNEDDFALENTNDL